MKPKTKTKLQAGCVDGIGVELQRLLPRRPAAAVGVETGASERWRLAAVVVEAGGSERSALLQGRPAAAAVAEAGQASGGGRYQESISRIRKASSGGRGEYAAQEGAACGGGRPWRSGESRRRGKRSANQAENRVVTQPFKTGYN